MLENSGLVLGVDASLRLLTWLHDPRHVGVALLVHGRLLHLTEERRGGEGEETARRSPITFNDFIHSLFSISLDAGCKTFIARHSERKQLFFKKSFCTPPFFRYKLMLIE